MSQSPTVLPDASIAPGKKVYFISDLHLGAPYSRDEIRAEKRIVAFLESVRHNADTIFLLGDIIDYWFEYKYVVPKGFIRFFGKLAELADDGVRLVWIIGNHDIWIKDYLPSQFSIEIYDGTLVQRIGGKRFFMGHGDGLGKTPRSFRFIRSMFRNRICQWLYAGIHPRWTIPFANAWSERSRRNGMAQLDNNHPLYQSLKDYSLEVITNPMDPRIEAIDYFVYGHLHILVRERLTQEAEMFVCGEWISRCSYLEFNGQSLEIHTFE